VHLPRKTAWLMDTLRSLLKCTLSSQPSAFCDDQRLIARPHGILVAAGPRPLLRRRAADWLRGGGDVPEVVNSQLILRSHSDIAPFVLWLIPFGGCDASAPLTTAQDARLILDAIFSQASTRPSTPASARSRSSDSSAPLPLLSCVCALIVTMYIVSTVMTHRHLVAYLVFNVLCVFARSIVLRSAWATLVASSKLRLSSVPQCQFAAVVSKKSAVARSIRFRFRRLASSAYTYTSPLPSA
jgi:hypothetical protein